MQTRQPDTEIAEGRLYDAHGRLYATASTTCLVFQAPSVPQGE